MCQPVFLYEILKLVFHLCCKHINKYVECLDFEMLSPAFCIVVSSQLVIKCSISSSVSFGSVLTYCIFQLCSLLPLPFFLSKILCDRNFSLSLQRVAISGSPLSPKQLCCFEDKLSLCKPSSMFCAEVQRDFELKCFCDGEKSPSLSHCLYFLLWKFPKTCSV